jgi:hypothetical protein
MFNTLFWTNIFLYEHKHRYLKSKLRNIGKVHFSVYCKSYYIEATKV